MTIRASRLAKHSLKNIEQLGRGSVGITRLVERQATWNLPSNQPHPFLASQADSSNASVIVFVRVGKTDDPVESHSYRPTLKAVN
jgi:hypothetical protein